MTIDCTNCAVTVKIEVLAEYSNFNEYDPSDAQRYSFAKCPNCFEPILVKNTRIWEFDDFIWGNPMRLYPSSTFHINPAIPVELRQALAESVSCFQAGLYTPTVIMCRRTLDGFCQIMGVAARNLNESLKTLKDDGKISTQLYEWATLLRETGNKAAHDINSTFEEIDARDLLDFTVAILDFTYSFKDKFDRFKIRQNS